VDLLQGEVDVGKLAASALVGNHVLRVVVFAWGEGREGGREGGGREKGRKKIRDMCLLIQIVQASR